MLSDEIKRLHELHLAGALTDAEFERAKARVLAGEPINLRKDGAAGGAFAAGPFAARPFVARFNGLRRVRTDRWLGGVCGGLARASHVDTWVWRLLFTLLTLTWGVGAVVYALLWLFVPEE